MNIEVKWYSQKELMELSGVSRQTVYVDIKKGELNAHKFGKSLRFTEDEVNRYVEKKKGSNFVKSWKQKKNTLNKN